MKTKCVWTFACIFFHAHQTYKRLFVGYYQRSASLSSASEATALRRYTNLIIIIIIIIIIITRWCYIVMYV